MITTITKNEFGEYLKNFEFKNLFITLGWNKDNTKLPPIEENKLKQYTKEYAAGLILGEIKKGDEKIAIM